MIVFGTASVPSVAPAPPVLVEAVVTAEVAAEEVHVVEKKASKKAPKDTDDLDG